MAKLDRPKFARTSVLIALATFLIFLWLITNLHIQRFLLHQTNTNPPTSFTLPHSPTWKLARSVAETPLGKLGPAKTKRHSLRYYDSLYYTALQFGYDANSLLEVGCSSDPFSQYLDWVDERTCVAPYFVEYSSKDGGHGNTKANNSNRIRSVVADFMEFPLDTRYDLVLCSQVLEHVPNPSAFMKRLIRAAKTSIISVPFEWNDCGEVCNHVTDKISYKMLLKWAYPHVPVFHSVVKEEVVGQETDKNKRRIILVFQSED